MAGSGGRVVWEGLLPPSLCAELKALSDLFPMMGYRSRTEATHVKHVLGSNCPGMALPLLRAREILLEAVQDRFSFHKPLYCEYTGLMAWLPGSKIGWHHDSNADYLEQRLVSAVAYLGDHNEDFRGGVFEFRNGEPREVVPRAGTVVAYFAGQENTHRVRQVESGRRVTLAMWFTADAAWCEDSRLLEAFGELPGQRAAPIPSEMFLAEDGVDSRLERLSALGFEVEERSAGGGHVLRLAASAEDGLDDDEVVCADLTECLRLAVLHRSSGRSADLAQVQRCLSSHLRNLDAEISAVWERSLRLGQILAPDEPVSILLSPLPWR